MKRTYDEKNARWVIEASGDMDIFTVPEIREHILDCIRQKQSDILLQAHKLDYLDSVGLGALVSALNQARAYGGVITIKGLKAHIRKLFVITGLDTAFNLEE